jgi:2-keto-4-pentenoate hydratase/2-oxohepta-3-ene-1,7-dioic acid hydratase in catechol pathway
MRLCSFELDGRATWGVVEDDGVVDLGRVHSGTFADLKSVIAAGALNQVFATRAEAMRHPLAAIRYLPVIPDPDKILCVGLNYEEHRNETGRAKAAHPTIFVRFANSQTGHLREVCLPRVSTQLDYEGELAVVIGKAGRYIDRSNAFDYVAGFSCYNDISVRDWQNHTHQFTPGKNFPATGAFGPWLVTPERFGALPGKRLVTRVNGVRVQSATLDQMIFDVPALIAYCSSFTRLEPGDVIVTGTPGGVGARRTPPLWLEPGAVTEVEIDGIGVLRNTITPEA